MMTIFKVTYTGFNSDDPIFLTCDSADPLNWDNNDANFMTLNDALNFMDQAYSSLIKLVDNWQNIYLEIVEQPTS